MRVYENVIFSLYCDDIFFKIGLFNILDKVQKETQSINILRCNEKKPRKYNNKDNYYWVDIVSISSKNIYAKPPLLEKIFDDERNGVIVFCTERMMNIMKGMSGYENAVFFTNTTKKEVIESFFVDFMTKEDKARVKLFNKLSLSILTDKEKLVTALFKKGMTHHEISKLTKMKVKTVSAHLRSAMLKYHVNSLLEYQVKLFYLNEIKNNHMHDP